MNDFVIEADRYGVISALKNMRVSTSLTNGLTIMDGLSDSRVLAVLSATANTGITVKIGDRLVFTGGVSAVRYAKSGGPQGETYGIACRSAARSIFDSQCHNPQGEKYEDQSLSSVIQDVIEREGLDSALFAPRTADAININSFRMQHGDPLGASLQNLVEDYYGVLTDNGEGVLSVYNIDDFQSLPEFVIRESETTRVGLNFNGDRRFNKYFAIARKDDKSEAQIVEGKASEEAQNRSLDEQAERMREIIERGGGKVNEEEFETLRTNVVADQVVRNRVFRFDNDLTEDQIRKALDYATNRSMVLGLSLTAVVSGELLNVQKGQPVSIESQEADSLTKIFGIPNSKWVIEGVSWTHDGNRGGSSTELNITPIEQYGAPDLPQEVYQRSVVLGGAEIGDGDSSGPGRDLAEDTLEKMRAKRNESN